MEAKGHIPQLPVAILGCASQIQPCAPRFKHVYIYISWLCFVCKPLYWSICLYMGHICPIQALHTYTWMPYICLLASFGCEYALCPLHISFWHVASLSSYIKKAHKIINTCIYIESVQIHTQCDLRYSCGTLYLNHSSAPCLTLYSKGIFTSPPQLTNTVVVVLHTL